jgi:hypothetical protein
VADDFIQEAMNVAASGKIQLGWQESDEKPGYFRLTAAIPVSAPVFDRLFNGRSGYRAQYYLSPEEGVLFNRRIVDDLIAPIRVAYERRPLESSFEIIRQTLAAPHAKIWILDEKAAFDEARPDLLNPPRWVANNARRGRKIPLRTTCAVDLKGAFLRPTDGQLFVDDLKLDRPWDLHRRGYT